NVSGMIGFGAVAARLPKPVADAFGIGVAQEGDVVVGDKSSLGGLDQDARQIRQMGYDVERHMRQEQTKEKQLDNNVGDRDRNRTEECVDGNAPGPSFGHGEKTFSKVGPPVGGTIPQSRPASEVALPVCTRGLRSSFTSFIPE